MALKLQGCGELVEKGPCRVGMVELGQNHLTVDRNEPVDRPRLRVDLK